ncbi:META domain-containing protein [Kribbella monticola]|uniref:META domain-containing protein n=1 Tax=Kribbella monticola TaxID=2185285 RepID=UPI000DD4C13A|nr:META domain-containing protein [Kribbella monticola]
MSKTELEEDLRATFERAAASVPLAPDLAGRATTGVRQAQRRTWIASGAAAAAIAVVAGVGFSLNHGSTSPPPTPVASKPTAAVTTAAVTTAQALAGTWRPVKLNGFTTLKVGRPDDPTLTFRSDGTWTGSDGCNSLAGTFTIGQRGEFTSHADGQRLIECGNVPHTAVLAAARRISTDQATLRFYAGDGREVAIYARTR